MRFFQVVVICLMVAAISSAQNNFSGRVRNTFTKEADQNPDMCVFVSHGFEKSNWSFAGFYKISNSWGQAYIGPSYKFSDRLSASAYAGLEVFSGWWRLAVDANYGYKKINWYNCYEDGGSGDFWLSDFTFAANNLLKAEAKAYKINRIYKLGAGGAVNLFKTPFSFSPILMYNFFSEKPEVETTIYFKF